jgi:hypothetical protein
VEKKARSGQTEAASDGNREKVEEMEISIADFNIRNTPRGVKKKAIIFRSVLTDEQSLEKAFE